MTATTEIRDHIELLAPEWERLAQHTKASPFLWPGWISAWWHAFGAGRPRIIAAYENGRLTGVLPLRRSHGKLASPTNYHTPLFGFLATDDRAVEQLAKALFSQRPRRVDLSFLTPNDIGAVPVRTAADAARYRMLSESRQVAPYVDTDGSFAAALAAFFTSRFGITGTILGTALTAMIITVGSALFGFYLERAAARTRNAGASPE